MFLISVTACGGGTPAPQTSDAPKADAAKPDPNAAGANADAKTETAKADAKPAEEPYEDATESASPIALAPLFDKKTPKSKFPKATIDDKKCWQEIGLTGDHQKDYAQLIDKCGAPTGLLEYVKPAHGKLHHEKDKRDTYTAKLSGGLCYRYFAVGDGTVKDIDILVMRANGSLIAEDKATSPVALIHNDQPWCMDDDEELQFHVEVDGPGRGGYLFGIWARPKK